MNIQEFDRIMHIYWKKGYNKKTYVPPEAKVVTGVAINDTFLHNLLVEHGVEIVLEERKTVDGRIAWKMKDINIVDEQKFAWFLLRWQ